VADSRLRTLTGMKNLRSSTMGILSRVESLSGRPVEFKPDSSLTLRATLQTGQKRGSGPRAALPPTNEPLDYWVAYQAGYLLRLLELPADERFDLPAPARPSARSRRCCAPASPRCRRR
jgi:hypothetical protein